MCKIVEDKRPLIFINLKSYFGKAKIINISIGAIGEYDSNEIRAAILHELGHFYHKHLLKNLFKFITFRKPNILKQEIEADNYVAENYPGMKKYLISLLSRNDNKERIKNLKSIK